MPWPDDRYNLGVEMERLRGDLGQASSAGHGCRFSETCQVKFEKHAQLLLEYVSVSSAFLNRWSSCAPRWHKPRSGRMAGEWGWVLMGRKVELGATT